VDDGDPDRELHDGDDRAQHACVGADELRRVDKELLGPGWLSHRVVDDRRAEASAEVRGLELEQGVEHPQQTEGNLEPLEPEACGIDIDLAASWHDRLSRVGHVHGGAYRTVSVPVMNGWIWQ
jgi:hypothetical protein